MIVGYDISTRYRVCFQRPDEEGFQSQYGTDDLEAARRYRDKMLVHPRWTGCQWRIESETVKSYRDVSTTEVV